MQDFLDFITADYFGFGTLIVSFIFSIVNFLIAFFNNRKRKLENKEICSKLHLDDFSKDDVLIIKGGSFHEEEDVEKKR